MLSKMLKTAIEIEGLIRILKDGDTSAEVPELLVEKTKMLSAEVTEFTEGSKQNETAGSPDANEESGWEQADSEEKEESQETAANPDVNTEVTETDTETEESDDIPLFSDEEPQQDKEKTDNPDKETSAKAARASDVAATDLKKYFSLNDRYLYSRELFGGDMKMFDSTLRFLEGITDFSDIEDYFYSELDWNPEDTNVASFLEILRPHFKE